jgi:hypothetical protein
MIFVGSNSILIGCIFSTKWSKYIITLFLCITFSNLRIFFKFGPSATLFVVLHYLLFVYSAVIVKLFHDKETRSA